MRVFEGRERVTRLDKLPDRGNRSQLEQLYMHLAVEECV